MANPEHLAILEQGVDAWNKWRMENPEIRPDLSGVDLLGADLKYANLEWANLRGANLEKANLWGATINNANLLGAWLDHANLCYVNLAGAKLFLAQMCEADLSGAILEDTELIRTQLRKANLQGTHLLRARMDNANLIDANMGDSIVHLASLIDAVLDGANLTGAYLWETKRSGWSIKDIICEYAYFDRDGIEKTDFKPGEFEKLYSDKTKIVLHYEDGMNKFEVTTLPSLIQFIESHHPGSSLRLRTIGEDAGGASVTVAVDELGDADLTILREDFERYKRKIRDEVLRDAEIEILVLQRVNKSLTDIIKDKMGDTFNIQQVTGVVKADSSTVNQTINSNDLAAVSKLISDILAARTEMEKVLPSEKANDFNAAFEIIQEQVSAPQKNWEKMKQAAQSVKNVLMSTGEVAGKWIPIVEKLAEAAHKSGMV